MKRGITLIAIALMSTGLLAQGTGRGAAPDNALATIQGTWVVNTINGQAIPPMSIMFKGDKYEQTFQGAVNERGVLKLNSTKKPVTIDLVIQEGSDAGKLQVGILEVTADTMKLKLAPAGQTTRPTTFTTEQGSSNCVLTKQKK